MKPKLFLHAGMPKTASRAIQQAFKNFDNEHVRYLRAGSANHSTLTQALSLPPEKLMRDFPERVHSLVEASAQKKFLIASVDAELAYGRQSYILSSEHLYHIPKSLFHESIVPFLEHRFGEIELICYIRPPKSYIQSAFQQKVKTGLSDFRLENPNYELKLGKFFETGWQVNLRPYRGTNVLRDFSEIVDVLFPLNEHSGENLSLTAHATALLYKFNATGELPEALLHLKKNRGRLIEKIARIGPPQPLSIDESVMMINSKDLEWVFNKARIDLSEPPSYGVTNAQEIMDLARKAEQIVSELPE